ncbi:MAG TPA: hypothetical protein VLB50_02820, partial [Ignavibacteriaceae bacterium]|nr:hypothetical protein [Ignavibacteriaceae bacterium]
SPEEEKAELLIGTDDGSKVFVNGMPVYRFLNIRVAEPDQDKISLDLKKGWNSLLIKIENNVGGYGFYARIRDLNKLVKVSPFKR